MDIASRFQPQNLAQQRFNPFYGEMPRVPWGPGIQRRVSKMEGRPHIQGGVVNQNQIPDWFLLPPGDVLEDYSDPFGGMF